ncbi:ClpXP protease specificity-enhancing factor [Methylotetracoccus oryzae]|uniref:ClpXP protease specificity-enhancing factor n=1 Tax=Methylotetracoccus oryzae TaxID=1919059 RepID=UPI00111AC991|nr:ClpXP protease specificity-enhancing factor [Methylotetracoccus oryzae]
MVPLKPYLVRAIYDWIVDNALTPFLLVDATRSDVDVPRQYVQDGRIVLNLNPQAVAGLSLGNDTIAFNARFGGTPTQVVVPLSAVLALYAKETGKGMVFDSEEDSETPPPEPDTPSPQKKKPALRVVK